MIDQTWADLRACVHCALFEDDFDLRSQIEVLKETLELFVMKYNPKAIPKSANKKLIGI